MFADHVTPLWPTFEQLSTVQDRQRLLAVAEELDIPIPETQLLSEIDEWDRELIVKARHALLTRGTADSGIESEAVSPPRTIFLEPGSSPNRQQIRTDMQHDPIVQEYVGGTEYTFRAIFDHGDPIATSVKKLVRGVRYSRGPSVCHQAVSLPELETHALKLLTHLEWHGPANVGFRRDVSTGEFKLMEVNPRFWGALPLDLHAGVDYPYYYWQLATGSERRFNPDYRTDTTTHRLRGELDHLASIIDEKNPIVKRPSLPGTAWRIASSIYEHPHFDYLSLDDPGPFVRDVMNGRIPSRFAKLLASQF